MFLHGKKKAIASPQYLWLLFFYTHPNQQPILFVSYTPSTAHHPNKLGVEKITFI